APPSPDAIAHYERLREARAHYAKKDFARAAAGYQKLAEANPEDGESWLRLARSRFALAEYRAAIAAYQRANALGFGFLQHNACNSARAYARLGEKEKALAWLETALKDHRFENRPSLGEDEAFRGLRADPRFRQLAGLLPGRAFSRDEGWVYDLD